jgi:hypothetical protein
MTSVRKGTIPTERPPLVSEVSANLFAVRGCHVVSMTNRYDRIPGFLYRSRYYLFQLAPQLYSRGWVDPVPDPLLFFCSAGIGGYKTEDKLHLEVREQERSNTTDLRHELSSEIVVSKPTRGFDAYMRLFCVYIVLCVGSGLAAG